MDLCSVSTWATSYIIRLALISKLLIRETISSCIAELVNSSISVCLFASFSLVHLIHLFFQSQIITRFLSHSAKSIVVCLILCTHLEIQRVFSFFFLLIHTLLRIMTVNYLNKTIPSIDKNFKTEKKPNKNEQLIGSPTWLRFVFVDGNELMCKSIRQYVSIVTTRERALRKCLSTCTNI